MTSLRRPASARHLVLIAGLALACGATPIAATANGADAATDPEREALAALTRQFDLIDRLATQAEAAAPQGPARYHFDYAQLRADVARMRAGVHDYLAPQRAQPRDLAPLSGDYARDTGLRDPEAP